MAKKRKDGYYKRVFTYQGKQYSVYAKSEKELFQKQRDKLEELEKGFNARENPTLEQYYNEWTEGRRGTIAESTLRGQVKMYEAMSRIQIPSAKRKLGEMKIKDIQIKDLRIVQSELLKSRYSQTVNDYLFHLSHCFSDAQKERVIDYNPCTLLKPLKRTEEKARDTKHRALTLEEQKRFFNNDRCKSSFYYNVFRFLVLTGCRIGEVGALKYSDIHDGLINVERTITRTEQGGYIVGDSAKTEAGRRQIPINAQLKAVIEEQKKINSIMYGNIVQMDDLLFRAPQGGLLMSTPACREVKRICKACNIEDFSCHGFRATFATRCLEAGMNPRTLQEILGHSDFSMTMNLYGHCLTDTKTEAMNNLTIAI